MAKLRIVLLILALVIVPTWIVAQETTNPPNVGGTPTSTRVANGQEIDIYVVGGEVDVRFTSITSAWVKGEVTRISGETVQVTIHWVNRGLWTTFNVGDTIVPFHMESGDIDKRNNQQQRD